MKGRVSPRSFATVLVVCTLLYGTDTIYNLFPVYKDLTDEAALRTVGSELDDLQQEENDTKQDRLGLASVRKGTRSRPNKPQEVLQSPLDLFISAKIASVHLVTNVSFFALTRTCHSVLYRLLTVLFLGCSPF